MHTLNHEYYFERRVQGMQPRQRFPMQGGMGGQMMRPGPFGGQGQMGGPFGQGRQMMGSLHHFGGGNPMMSQMMGQMAGRPQQGRRSGGGLLSKILGGKNKNNGLGGLRGMQAAARGNSGGGGIGSILQTLSKPEGLTGILNNTQQVLKTAQTIGPMIQQYGPIVKNLPMMWKLYKGFKDLPSGETTAEDTSETPISEDEQTPKRNVKKKPEVEPVEEVRNHHQGNSVPKLYI
jgi:YqfQ-like protein